MQTMPSKTRTSMVIAGVAALIVVVGLIAFGVNQRAKQEVGKTDPLADVAEPQNGAAGGLDRVSNTAANASPETGSKTDKATNTDVNGASPATDKTADSKSQEGATPALTTLGAVPPTHKVAPDETLYTISLKYYKTHIYAGDIESLNELADPNQITVGMELKLPQPKDLAGSGN